MDITRDSGEGNEARKEEYETKIDVDEDNSTTEEAMQDANKGGHERRKDARAGRESPQEKSRVENKGKGKEEVEETNSVKTVVDEDSDKGGHEHHEYARIAGEFPLETRRAKDKASLDEIMDSPPYAGSSTPRRRTKGKPKMERRHDAQKKKDPRDDVMISRNRMLKTSSDEEYERFLKRANPMFFIRKVHSGLRRQASDKHYEPVLLSIGPYHHRKNTALRDMEKHKFQYLELVINKSERDSRKDESSAEYLEALENKEVQALDCYVDTFHMKGDNFRKCLVRDGFFMIGLFLKNADEAKFNDMLFDIKWMKPRLERDMLLFENQIPLFVLRKLAAFTKKRPQEEELISLALRYFKFNGKRIYDYIVQPLTPPLDKIPHLLGLVYHALMPETPEPQWKSCDLIRTAVSLGEAGVKFVKANEDKRFYDIDFLHGKLSIPRLEIDDNTESFFRNLVAYEQYSGGYHLHRVTDYLRVMDCLINTDKDVQLLRHSGIIDNRIGDDKKVSFMFNQLCCGVYFDHSKFFYAETFKGVNEFCDKPWNSWWANLKNNYFGSPWSVISFLAALALLVLALLQTIFSGLSYNQSTKLD